MSLGAALPIEEALPRLLSALTSGTNAVLIAPPGAGKTTGVPLALLDQPWLANRTILILEPRRVAARAAAERMATTLGERVGERVGYRIRREKAVSARTRIEVITEGILTRRLQRDPGLEGVAAVIFDEYHERSIHADLGLALCLDVQSALREDLRVIVMSATLDGEAVASILGDAPTIRSEGRAHQVETRWLETPWRRPNASRDAFEKAVTQTVKRALQEEYGDVLVFLPGVREIDRVQGMLAQETDSNSVDLRSIHGSMPFAKQRAALAEAEDGRRRVVLATAIAETSLTIEGVRIVVDGGLARRVQFDAGAGMARLVTGRVSRASAEQRRGRAGRTEPGVCYRLWTKGEEGGLMPADPPEIAEADLASLALDLAVWGIDKPCDLRWLDPPPATAFDQACDLLRSLGALGSDGRPTDHGRILAEMPLHPRLAHLLVRGRQIGAGGLAADVAALLEERDPLWGAGVDVNLRIEVLRGPKGLPVDRAALSRVKETAKQLRFRSDEAGSVQTVGSLVALAYPDRIAARRSGDDPRYVMANGKGAYISDAADALASEPYLAIAHLDGNPREAKIRLAARLTRAEIDQVFPEQLTEVQLCHWDARTNSVEAREQVKLGAAVLEDRPWRSADSSKIASAAADGVRALGLNCLPWAGAAERFRDRVRWLHDQGPGVTLPDWSEDALLDTLDHWLTPHLGGIRKRTDLDALDLAAILRGQLDWDTQQRIDMLAPASLKTAAGTGTQIDYSQDPPAVDVRIQEMFGEARHPTVLGGKVRLLIRFLSPARRPVQITSDLSGFWQTSYADVRRDLRGRYPRHSWPEDPLSAEATSRAKPRRR